MAMCIQSLDPELEGVRRMVCGRERGNNPCCHVVIVEKLRQFAAAYGVINTRGIDQHTAVVWAPRPVQRFSDLCTPG